MSSSTRRYAWDMRRVDMIVPCHAGLTELMACVSACQASGAVIEAGELLASLQLANPERTKKIEPFNGTFTPGGWSEGMPSILSSTEDEDEDYARSVLIDAITQVLDSSACDVLNCLNSSLNP